MLTAKRLRELLDYDPETGRFIWRTNRKGHACKGKEAGDLHPRYQYWRIGIEGRRYRRAHLAFLWMTGQWQLSREVDHKNCVPSDDRWKNLRPATRQQQLANQRPRGRLKLKGVCKWKGKYRAQIKVNQKNIYLGDFSRANDASRAYAIAARKYFGEFARI